MRRVEGITGLALGLTVLIVTMSAGVAMTARSGGGPEPARSTSAPQVRAVPGATRAPLAAVTGAGVTRIGGRAAGDTTVQRRGRRDAGRDVPQAPFAARDAGAALGEAAAAAEQAHATPAREVSAPAAVVKAVAGTARPVARAATSGGAVSRRARRRSRRAAAGARAREKDVIARVPRPAPASRPAAPAPVALTAAPAGPAAAPAAPAAAAAAAPATAQRTAEPRYACERDVRSAGDIRVRCERLSASDPRYDTAPPLEQQTAGATRVDVKD
jgi:hypothetical protein